MKNGYRITDNVETRHALSLQNANANANANTNANAKNKIRPHHALTDDNTPPIVTCLSCKTIVYES